MASSEVALDIECRQLLEWLGSRRVIGDKWQRELEVLQNASKKALAALGKDIVKRALPRPALGDGDDGIIYSDCATILTWLLKEAEKTGGPKLNMLRQYKDPHIYEFDRIKNQYESTDVQLAEAARLVIQYCIYEIPALRAELESQHNKLKYANKRVKDAEKSIKLAKTDLQKVCGELGIGIDSTTDSHIERCLVHSVSKSGLRDSLQAVREALRTTDTRDAIVYYRDFKAYLSSATEGATKTAPSSGPILAAIDELQRMDEPSEIIDLADTKHADDGDDGNALVADLDIDWGDMSAGLDAEYADDGGCIDWGITEEDADEDEAEATAEVAAAVELEGGGIDFGVDDGAAVDDSLPGASAEEMGIDFGDFVISCEGSGDAEGEGDDADAVRPDLDADAATHLSLGDTMLRETVLNETLELLCFLRQRQSELGSASGDALWTPARGSNVADSVRHQSLGRVQAMLQSVEKAQAQLDDQRLHKRLLIASSAKFRQRQTERVLACHRRIDKFRAQRTDTLDRRSTLERAVSAAHPRCAQATATAKALKAQVIASLSAHLKGRKVNIIGAMLHA